MSKKRIFVGISGGVDSAVSLALLKDAGFDVVGIFMKNWSGDDYGIQSDCPWKEDQEYAESVCKLLNVEFLTWNFEKEYREKVVEYFFSEYSKGRTPNPDIMCNKEIKFKLFLEKAVSYGADFIATGHYSRKSLNNYLYEEPSNFLYKGIDINKDQSYFLYSLSSNQLLKSIFPVGGLKKIEVRNLAHKYKLPNAKRKDSQGICFIGDINVMKFLMNKITPKEGDIVDIETGRILGVHKGVYFYTIGQRDKLNIGGSDKPYYVCKKDVINNILYVAKGFDNNNLYSQEVYLENLHIINKSCLDILVQNINLEAVIRYRQKPTKVFVEIPSNSEYFEEDGSIKIINNKSEQNSIVLKFEFPQRAVASGQSAVIYYKDMCLGGGIIR